MGSNVPNVVIVERKRSGVGCVGCLALILLPFVALALVAMWQWFAVTAR